MRTELTQARLKEIIHYDPDTGYFTWLVSNSNRTPVGSCAGSRRRRYAQITVDKIRYQAHRLAFLYMTGSFPPAEADHINRDPTDNRWSNLRAATSHENKLNRRIQSNNKSGYRGVSWYAPGNKWRVRGTINRREIALGYYDQLEEAAAVARRWRAENHGEFAA